jgi:ketosteroid isomerase-like protein
MTEHATTANVDQPAWSVEMFAQFWANPDPALVPAVLTEDVVGHWPGRDEPARGRDEYSACIAAIVEALPGMYMEVAEHARNGDFVFVRWILYATGKRGPFELTGMDRIRVRGGQVAENVIVFDTAAFETRSGMPVPWDTAGWGAGPSV